jgi:hypothetical protein
VRTIERRCCSADRSRARPGLDDGLEYLTTLLAALPMAPYRPRLTRSLGVYKLAGWSVKLIGITAFNDLPGDPVLALPWRMKTGSLAPRAGCGAVGAPGFSDMT